MVLLGENCLKTGCQQQGTFVQQAQDQSSQSSQERRAAREKNFLSLLIINI